MLKKSNKISLEEATRLAILGKLPLNESTTVTTTDDNITMVETDDANIVIEPKEDAAVDVCPDCGATEVPVEAPVEEIPAEEIPAEDDLEESKKIEEGEAPLFKKKINKTDIKKVESKDKGLKEHKVAFKSSNKLQEGVYAYEYIGTFNELYETSWGQAKRILDEIAEAGKEEELMDYLEEYGSDPENAIDRTSLNDLLAYDWEIVFEALGINEDEDEDEDLDESKKVESKDAELFKKKINKTDIKKVENVEKDLDLKKAKKEEHKLAVKENRVRKKKVETIEATEIHYIDDFMDLKEFCWGTAAQQTLDEVERLGKEDDLIAWLEDVTGGEIDATGLNDIVAYDDTLPKDLGLFYYADEEEEDLDESKKVESKLQEGEAPLFKKKINKTDIKKVENKKVEEDCVCKETGKTIKEDKKEETLDESIKPEEDNGDYNYFYSPRQIIEICEDKKYEHAFEEESDSIEELEKELQKVKRIESEKPIMAINQPIDDTYPGWEGCKVKTILKDGREFVSEEDTLSVWSAVQLVVADEVMKESRKPLSEEVEKEEAPKRHIINKVDLRKTESITVEKEAQKDTKEASKDIEDHLKTKVAEGLTKFVKEAYTNGKEVKVEKILKLTENKLYVKGSLVMENSTRDFSCKLIPVMENKSFRKYTIKENKLLKITEGKTSKGKEFNLIVKK